MDKIFVDGIKCFKPHEKAPEFVIANLKIDKPTLQAFLNTQPDEVNVVMKKSQKGGYYMEVNTWKKDEKQDLPF